MRCVMHENLVVECAGHPGSDKLLKKAGITHADSLMLCGMQSYDDTEADIQARSSSRATHHVPLPPQYFLPHTIF